VRRTAIGPDGRFARVVAAGDHRIGVAAAGYAALNRAVTARAGAPNDLGDLLLAPAP
jgi:hypothetical protein